MDYVKGEIKSTVVLNFVRRIETWLKRLRRSCKPKTTADERTLRQYQTLLKYNSIEGGT